MHDEEAGLSAHGPHGETEHHLTTHVQVLRSIYDESCWLAGEDEKVVNIIFAGCALHILLQYFINVHMSNANSVSAFYTNSVFC